jgi:hypothetical protein
VTSQKDQIQSLIADVEQALGAERPRKPWIRASETEPQRQALARVQVYLKSLQEVFDAPGGWGPVDPSTGQVAGSTTGQAPGVAANHPAVEGIFSGSSAAGQATSPNGALSGSAEDVLQALLTEMKFLRSSALEPLRLEMDRLRVQRDRLRQEVSALADEQSALSLSQSNLASSARASVSEDQLNQFLAALMDRLQERLSSQVTQTLSQLESDHAEAVARLSAAVEPEVLQLRPSSQGNEPGGESGGQLSEQSMAQLEAMREEEMRQLQARSDQLLVNIESTLQGMFETLQRNIDSYQISLNEGIENMHSLGRQGEGIVQSLVDHLTQQLGQTAPPEPAFFPSRSASPLAFEPAAESPAAESDVAASAVANSMPEKMTESVAPDTVASLDEILPEAMAEGSRESEAALQTENLQTENLQTENLQTDLKTDNDELRSEIRPEDCIQEDGTIDLDLLKLDIDRDDEANQLGADDLMIDAAIADAQVAASEVEDPVIEAKVMPTADAVYLADLTLDDLTLDDLRLDGSEEPPEDVPLPDINFLGSSVQLADGSVDGSSDDSADASANDSELADLLPDFSEPAAESGDALEGSDGLLESAIVPDIPKAASGSVGSVISRSDGQVAHDDVDDGISAHLAATLEADSRAADRVATESTSRGLDVLASDLPDLEEATVFEAEAPPPPVLGERSQPLESALIPDLPESSQAGMSEPVSERGMEADSAQFAQLSDFSPLSDFVESSEDSFEASLQELEGESEDEAEEASDSGDPDIDSDATSPEQATFLDEDIWASESGDRSESNVLESNVLGEDDSKQNSQEDALTEPPSDFDDDLDFYSEADESAASATEPAEAETLVDMRIANPDAVLELPVLEPPSAPPTAPISETTEAIMAAVTTAIPAQSPVSEGLRPSEPEQGDDLPEGGQPVAWFLGLDIGTTGISAVLINQLGDQVYPLCWNIPGDDQANRFRLPAVLQMDASAGLAGAVGSAALQQSDRLLRNLKPLLKVGIPRSTGEPWIQWSDSQMLPLLSIQGALTTLLQTLSPSQVQMSCQAVGLKNAALRQALSDLKGVIVGYPNNWPDTYSFNIREALLGAGIVQSSEQVFFVEEAIAALLSALPDPNTAHEDLDNQQPGLYNCNWSGGTVVISAGATLSEAAIADLPQALDQLIYRDFALRSFTYAGDSLDQDIICQLLHLPAQARLEANAPTAENAATGWQSLGLHQLNLPQPGEADRIKRHRLRQRLNNSPLGHEVISAARKLKLILQEETQCEWTIADQTWVIKRKDLESKVFLPYIQRVNRQINSLLSQKGLSAQAVKQVICTGGSASLGAIARWLRQKFPNATIIQDTYSGEYSNSCSRVAYGLANLCHYPHVLDTHRHQYNDYFLLLELLRVLPDQPLPAGGILHLLEQRGINTQACQSHILALIEGHLPPGLVPTEGDRPMISAQSPDIAAYQMLAELPLFRKQGGQIYIADPQQGERLRHHLETVLVTKSQTLQEPLTADLLTTARS